MKTNIFLIYKYWKANKDQFVKMLIPIIILTVLILAAILMERTECRRTFEEMLFHYGTGSYTYLDLSGEILDEMQSDDLVQDMGSIAVCGKLGDEYQQYTYGAYIDGRAEELEHLKLTAGRFPSAPGEVTLYDHVLEDRFFTSDPETYIGKNITFSEYDFGIGNEAGECVGNIELKIVGIIDGGYFRNEKETSPGFSGAGDLKTKSTPVIYLFKDDCEINENTCIYTIVKLFDSDIQTQEQSDKEFNDFLVKYNEKYRIAPFSSGGILNAARTVTNFSIGSEEVSTRIYNSDTMTVINYFSVISIIISAISLFGILFSVMPERMKSLEILQKIGCSKLRTAAIIFMEWLFLLICGIIAGGVIGIALYELILFIQERFMGLSYLRGYAPEWAVLQVTNDPFLSAVLCSVCMFALGYIIYFIRFLFKKKQQIKGRKVRSLNKILVKISGNSFANSMQILSLALVLFAAVMCYSYFTMNGKGTGYFTDEELKGDRYYSDTGINMRDSGTDISVYVNGGVSTFGLSVVEDRGLPSETLDKIAEIEGVSSAEGYDINGAFNVFYPEDAKDVPSKITEFYAPLADNADEIIHPDERKYYITGAVFGSDTAIERLSEYVIDGKLGTYKNGLTMVFYERDGIKNYPYKIGDKINSIANDGGIAHCAHDTEWIIEAIAVIPETAHDNDPIAYTMYDSMGMTFAAPQENAVFAETYKYKYDRSYIFLDEGANIDSVTSQIKTLLDSSMRVNIKTIKECDEAYRSSYIKRFASVVLLFVILILMAVVGYHSIISMKLQIGKPKIAILRALGLSDKKYGKTFLMHNILNTFISCIIGTGLIYALRYLLKFKYEQALNAFGYPGADLLGASAEVYKTVNDLSSVYLLKYEIHNADIVSPLIILSCILIIMTAVMSYFMLSKNKGESIISQMNEHGRE